MERFQSLADIANNATADRIIKEATSPEEFATMVYQQAIDIIERDKGQTAARLRRNCRATWPGVTNLKQALIDAVGDMYASGCIQLLAEKSLQYGAAKFDPFRVAMRMFPYWDFNQQKPECKKVGLIKWLDAMSLYDFEKNETNEIAISGCGIITIEDAASVYADRTREEPAAKEVVEELSELRETGWAEDQPSQNFGNTGDADNREEQEFDQEDHLGAIVDPFEDRLTELVEDFDIENSMAEISPLWDMVVAGLDELLTKKLITADTHAQQVEFVGRKCKAAQQTLTFQMAKTSPSY